MIDNEEGKDVDQVTLSEMNIEASKSAAEVLESSTPKGNDGQQGRGDQSRMKEHVRFPLYVKTVLDKLDKLQKLGQLLP